MVDKYKNYFTEKRWDELCKAVAELGMKVTHDLFTVSELNLIIDEAQLSDKQREGAKMYYIHGYKQREIAEHFYYTRTAIDYQKRKVSEICRKTCLKIFK